MSMNGPDLTKMPPSLTAAIIIALIVLTAVLEAIDSPNTLTLIAALVGVIGLQQARTSQATSRIEHQTNGVMERRHAEMQSAMAEIAATQKRQGQQLSEVVARLERGDVAIHELQERQGEIREQLANMPLCEVPAEGEGS